MTKVSETQFRRILSRSGESPDMVRAKIEENNHELDFDYNKFKPSKGTTYDTRVSGDRGFFKTVGDVLTAPGDLASGAIRRGVGATVENLTGKTTAGFTGGSASNEELRQNLADTGTAAKFALPVAAGIGTAPLSLPASVGAVAGATFLGSAAEGVTDFEDDTALDIVREGVTDATIGAAIDAGTLGLGRVAKPVFQALRPTAAKRLLRSNLALQNNQIRRIRKPNIAGKDPEEWLLDRGIVGTREEVADQLQELAKTSKQSVDEGLSNITGTFSNKQADEMLDEIIETLSKGDKPLRGQEAVVDVARQLRARPEKTLSELNAVKRLGDRTLNLFKVTGDVKESASKEGIANMRDQLKTFIEREADRAGLPDIKELNKQTQVANDIIKAIDDTGGADLLQRLSTVTRRIGQAGSSTLAGWAVGGRLGAVAGLAGEELMSSPKVRAFILRRLASEPDEVFKSVQKSLQRGTMNAKTKAFVEEVREDLSDILKAP